MGVLKSKGQTISVFYLLYMTGLGDSKGLEYLNSSTNRPVHIFIILMSAQVSPQGDTVFLFSLFAPFLICAAFNPDLSSFLLKACLLRNVSHGERILLLCNTLIYALLLSSLFIYIYFFFGAKAFVSERASLFAFVS